METPHRYPLIIEKRQWDRIQKLAGKLEEPGPQGVSAEYVQKLIQQSKELTKNWPDSYEGIVLKNKLLLEKKKNKEKEMMKSFKEREELDKRYNAEPIEKAREMLFNSTGYGRQLISAVLESRAIEEREAQIKLKNELKEKAKELERKLELKNTLVLGKEKTKEEIVETNKAFVEINKATYEHNKREVTKANEKEKLLQLDDARKMKELLEMEAHAMDACKMKAREDIKQCAEDNKRIAKEKARRQATDDAIVETWKKYNDRVQCMTKNNLEKIIKEKTEGASYQTNYALLTKLQDEEQKRYDDFIGNAVNTMEHNMFLKDETHDLKKQLKATEVMKENLIQTECKRLQKQHGKDECVHSSLYIPQRDARNKSKLGAQHGIGKYQNQSIEKSLLTPSNKLLTELKLREQEKSPWTGAKGAHEQFAKHAAEVLKECVHKSIARKVVDKYRKENHLDEKSLPVLNY